MLYMIVWSTHGFAIMLLSLGQIDCTRSRVGTGGRSNFDRDRFVRSVIYSRYSRFVRK